MSKLLTIIIPTYNMESYLHTCLSSLILPDESQMRLFEALVIIDGATDRSEEIAREYETRYPDTFRTIVKENGHYGSCINRGIKESKGKYIKTLDADDHFDNIVFKEFLLLLSTTDADSIINYTQVIYSDGTHGEKYGMSESFFSQFGSNQTSFSLAQLVISGEFRPSMHNVTYRTSILREINYQQHEGVFYSDGQWVFLPMANSETVELFPNVLYKYLIGREGQSVSSSVFKYNFKDQLILRETLIKQYENFKGTETGKRYLYITTTLSLMFVYKYGIFDTGLFYEKDVRHLDNKLREWGYSHWKEMASWKVHSDAYRHSVSIDFWRKSNGRWFYILEGIIKFFWNPYKALKKKLHLA